MAIREAIILAGGLGTRLREIVSDTPKPMAIINERPFLAYLMDYWIKKGITRFVLSVGYLSEKITTYFGDFYCGCDIRYVYEKNPLGTGGAVKKVLFDLDGHDDQVLLINGDTWFEINLKEMEHISMNSNAPIVMALKPLKKNDRYGKVELENQKVISFSKASSGGPSLINGGCYLINTHAIKVKMSVLPERFSLEQDFLCEMAIKGYIAANIQDVSFLDIGVPDDYKRAAQFLG